MASHICVILDIPEGELASVPTRSVSLRSGMSIRQPPRNFQTGFFLEDV